MQDYADTIATYNQSLINSTLPQSYWLQAACTGFKQGLLSSPWWCSFCDGTCGNFLTASVSILFEAWARNQDYVHPHPKGTLLQVGWPRSHSRHCELELGCDICRRAGLEQLMHIIQQMRTVVIIRFTGLWIKETGNDLQWHNHFYSVKSTVPSDPKTSFGLPHLSVHCFK